MPHLELATLFPNSAAINTAAPSVDARMDFKSVPAKCAVYLLTGPDPSGGDTSHPYLLATVGNLRAALLRRLADDPPELTTKRIQYGKVCIRVHWRIVHSPFAANFGYWSAARALFPDTYKPMIAWRPAWWLAVEKEAEFPEFHRTQDLSDPTLRHAGPIRDKSSAGKLIETLQDLFDLCRYHHILIQAPQGKACAYKEMGKCPAPCDGSVPLSWYHAQINRAFQFAANAPDVRTQWLAETQSAMKAAAANLQFEQAAKIKQRLARATFLESEAFAHLAPLEHFAFLALQPGQGKTRIEPWLIHPAQNPSIQVLPQIKKKDIPAAVPSLFSQCQKFAALPITPPIPPATLEQLVLVTHHLFKGSDDPALYLPLHTITSPAVIVEAATKLLARKTPKKPLPEHASDKIAESSVEKPDISAPTRVPPEAQI